jgi:hypothetical protein
MFFLKIPKTYSKTQKRARRSALLMEQRESLIQIKVEARRNTLCISRVPKRRGGSKDPLGRGKTIQEYAN